MRIAQLLTSTAFAAGLAVLSPVSATAQYIYPPCSPFPLTWPFCIVGAAAAVVTAPFRAIGGWPNYGYSGPPYYPPPPPPPYYGAPPPGAAAAYGSYPQPAGYPPQAAYPQSAYPQPNYAQPAYPQH